MRSHRGPTRLIRADKIAHDFTKRGILIGREQILVQLSKSNRLVAERIIAS
jgi:hypothetical protein